MELLLQPFTQNKQILLAAVDGWSISKNDVRVGVLGKGISGSVEARKTRNNQMYVVKIYHSREAYESKKEYRERVLYEYDMLRRLHHPNIIEVYGYRIKERGLRVEILLEMGSIPVSKLILKAGDKVDSTDIVCLWKQVCLGIGYMHSLNICHRDIKPENLVLDLKTGIVKIIDLATAIEIPPDGQVYGLVGSEAYAAPETYKYIKYSGKEADIWSLGILLFMFLNHRLPWKYAKEDDKQFSLYMETANSDSNKGVNNPIYDSIMSTISNVKDNLRSESILRIIFRLLQVDPGNRPGIDEFDSNKWYSDIES